MALTTLTLIVIARMRMAALAVGQASMVNTGPNPSRRIGMALAALAYVMIVRPRVTPLAIG
jgi:hypothetical protein